MDAIIINIDVPRICFLLTMNYNLSCQRRLLVQQEGRNRLFAQEFLESTNAVSCDFLHVRR